MPIRNPFKKSPTAAELHEQNFRDAADRGFKTADVNGIKAIEIKQPIEYQLSGKFSFHADYTLYLAQVQRPRCVEFPH
jgi:hypothetical protein